MRFFRYLLLLLGLPFMLQAQHAMVNAELGLTSNPYPLFKTDQYLTPGLSVTGAFRRIAVKAGGFMKVNTYFDEVYTLYGMGGLTTKLKRRISAHLLGGVYYRAATRPERGDYIYYNGNSLVVNAGVVVSPFLRRKHIVLGLEAYAWREKIGYVNLTDKFYDQLTLNVTFGFRF